jgi:hypothetical protein
VVFVRRRILYIQSLCPLSDDSPPEGVEQIYNDLLELVRSVKHHNVSSRLDSDRLDADPTSTLSKPKSKH